MTSQPGKQLIEMYILRNISKIKRNQTMRNIFPEKSYTKCETIPRSFCEK